MLETPSHGLSLSVLASWLLITVSFLGWGNFREISTGSGSYLLCVAFGASDHITADLWISIVHQTFKYTLKKNTRCLDEATYFICIKLYELFYSEIIPSHRRPC